MSIYPDWIGIVSSTPGGIIFVENVDIVLDDNEYDVELPADIVVVVDTDIKVELND